MIQENVEETFWHKIRKYCVNHVLWLKNQFLLDWFFEQAYFANVIAGLKICETLQWFLLVSDFIMVIWSQKSWNIYK